MVIFVWLDLGVIIESQHNKEIRMYSSRSKQVAVSMIDFFVGLAEVFLGFRFALKLFGASSANDFVSWIYDMSSVLLAPFRGIFPTEVFENKFVLEFSTLFAMLVYALVGYLLYALVSALTPDEEVVTTRSR